MYCTTDVVGFSVLVAGGLFTLYKYKTRRVRAWRRPRLQAPLAPIRRPEGPSDRRTMEPKVSPAKYLRRNEFGLY